MARGEAGMAAEERQLWESPCVYSGAEGKENEGGVGLERMACV